MNTQQQPKVGAGVGRVPSPAEIELAAQTCQQQLHAHRQKIISLYSLFLRTSAAYYTMCDLSDDVPADSHEMLLAMAELRRRGLLNFSDAAFEQVSKDYVQSLKMLKQAVDNSVMICDRLAMLTSARLRQQQPETPAQPPEKSQPVFNSLDEALEAELNAEGE